ncbi:tetratricopeptide repeat protein [Hymenobacter sp. HMF4947]|uniref:Tetratricopeptide repeat protein n=1 Tax=Hymenobacter ginkgonis TaxID=2682976 RepID=A0A7K1TCU2_9BACT|nr:tetratricopeptide repeat protein [Hymenobacter ginkgonis]MVN76218.1 tetratricopeptide repeat protein [Hymenobacter ginkgonis]
MDLVKPALLAAALAILSPTHAWAQQSESLAASFGASYAAEAKADYDDAIAALKGSYANLYEQNLRLGWLYFLAKNYTASAVYYQKAVDQRPYAIEPKFGLVKPLNALGQVEKMLGLYLAILQTDPQNTQANYWTGVIYLNRKAFDKAARYFERVVNLYPFDYDTNLSLAWTYLNLGKKTEARALYNKVLLIRPGDTNALAGLKRL